MSSTRSEILDAAGKQIPYRGFYRTSIDDILQAIGIGKGNFRDPSVLGGVIEELKAYWAPYRRPGVSGMARGKPVWVGERTPSLSHLVG
jgi:hypothetical protein